MNDGSGWDGWPGDEPPEDDTADLSTDGFGDDPFNPADPSGSESGAGAFGAQESDPFGVGGEPDGGSADDGFGAGRDGDPTASLWYGQEPLDDSQVEVGFGAGDTLAGDDDPDAVAGFGPADPDPAGDDETGPAGGDGDTPVGADPDLAASEPSPAGDATWGFPDPVHLDDLPDPVDGYPWADAGLLGDSAGAALPDPRADLAAAPPAADLFAYAGEAPVSGGPGWAALLASPDPATSTLARFWAPGG